MLRGRFRGRTRWWFVVGAVALLISGTAVVLLAADDERGLSATDREAIASVARNYKIASASTSLVPKELQGEVISRRQALAKKGTPVRLGVAVLDRVDRDFEQAVRSLGTPRFAQRQLQWRTDYGLAAASTLEENLNRLDVSPLIAEEFEVVKVEPAGQGEGSTRVKITMWIGDTHADGSRLEAWAVYEYTMVRGDASWKIDDEREVWAFFDADPDQWGPASPHDEGESTTGDQY